MQIVTWNTQWCCGLDGLVSPERIVQGARALADFDVLCLQEIAVNYPALEGGAGHDQPALLQALLPGYQLFFGAAVDEWSADGQRRRFGNLIATRLPVCQVQHHALPYPADPGVRSMPRMCTEVTVRDPVLGAVRVMTTHLEFYSKPQRMAQARALRNLHRQACAQSLAPPELSHDGSPFQSKEHTLHAIVCGDFNLEAHEPEYAVIGTPERQLPGATGSPQRLWDSWHLLHPDAPPDPTFRLYDRRYGPEPVRCDFFFVSDSLKHHVREQQVDVTTQVSDHQPVALRLG